MNIIHSSLTLVSAKIINKLEIKKEKGEKFENNVGMTNFFQNIWNFSK